ncbi:MAG: BatA domain-containing protein [Planctomycetota bacterium]
MIFLNLFLIGGLAAITAPIIIHLLHRSKVTSYDWGAMIFLEELLAERAKRIRMHEWLLLLVRALLVSCLALALMRPMLNWARGEGRSPGAHTSSIILMDDSYSMNAGCPRSAWLEAREQALRYVDTLRKGDDATVLFASSASKGSPPAALFDLDRIREIIRSAAPCYEKNNMPCVIQTALQQLESCYNPQRELVVFSDMQAVGWELQDSAQWSFLANTVNSSLLRPNIILASVAEHCPCNIALTDLTVSRAVVDCYTPVTFHVTVTNTGSEAVSGVVVSFAVDGAPKTTRSVDLLAQGRETLSLEHKFERAGSHYISCKLRCTQDVLDDDDQLLHSVAVIDRLPVLIVDGDHREQRLSSESGFLHCALSPRDEDDPNWRTVIEPSVVDLTDLRGAELAKYKVVVLANVAALPSAVISELERFVIAGGGLLITLGNRVQAEAYNRDLYRQGSGLLPVLLKRISSAKDDSGDPVRLVSDSGSSVIGEKVHLGGIVSNTPALDIFRPEKGQDWSKATIRSYFTTALLERREDAHTLVSFSNGAAALVQKKLGEGKVLLLTTAIDLDWSDLPVHPFYVPLMQNLIMDLASIIIPPRNLRVGQTLTHVAVGDAARKTHLLTSPQGESIALKSQSQGATAIFSHENTEKPGLYTVIAEGAAPEERVYYVVAPDRDESNLIRMQKPDYQKLERDLGARHAPDWHSLSRFIGLDVGGYELSEDLIMAAILLCFVEIYLTRRWA